MEGKSHVGKMRIWGNIFLNTKFRLWMTGLWACETSLCIPPKELGTLWMGKGAKILPEMIGKGGDKGSSNSGYMVNHW